jgi:hypothetical protein
MNFNLQFEGNDSMSCNDQHSLFLFSSEPNRTEQGETQPMEKKNIMPKATR